MQVKPFHVSKAIHICASKASHIMRVHVIRGSYIPTVIEIMNGYAQIMNMASCNRTMDISYYMSEASQVILDDIYLYRQVHTCTSAHL